MDKPEQDLRRAKEWVRATIAGAVGTTPPTVKSRVPIKPLPADIAAKVQARAQAGLDPVGSDSPSSGTMRRVVVPSAVLALLDAVLLVIALVAGNGVLAVVAAVLLIVFAAVAVLGRRATSGDSLRLTAADRLAIAGAGRWTSSQAWSGPVASTQECALVVAAARAAQRVVSSPQWASGELVRNGVTVAIGPELDQVDAYAFELASHRYREFPGGLPGTPISTPELDDAWERTLTRVAALTAYADTLDGLADRRTAAVNQPGQTIDATLELSDRDALLFLLSASIYDVN